MTQAINLLNSPGAVEDGPCFPWSGRDPLEVEIIDEIRLPRPANLVVLIEEASAEPGRIGMTPQSAIVFQDKPEGAMVVKDTFNAPAGSYVILSLTAAAGEAPALLVDAVPTRYSGTQNAEVRRFLRGHPALPGYMLLADDFVISRFGYAQVSLEVCSYEDDNAYDELVAWITVKNDTPERAMEKLGDLEYDLISNLIDTTDNRFNFNVRFG